MDIFNLFKESEAKAKESEAKAKESEAKAKESEAKAKESEAKAKESEARLNAIYRSKSWRITSPLRFTFQSAKALLKGPKNLKAVIKNKSKILLGYISLFVNQQPKLRRTVLSLLVRFPTLMNFLKSATNANSKNLPSNFENLPSNFENLSPITRKIYDDLKSSIQKRQKEHS
jgi:hypothetical protein